MSVLATGSSTTTSTAPTSVPGIGKVILTESAAILIYLAEKAGKLLPKDSPRRGKVFEQLFFNTSCLGPAFKQAHLAAIHARSQPARQVEALWQVRRVLEVLDHCLQNRPYVAGDVYSIADIAHFSWIWRHQTAGVSLDDFPCVASWYYEISARPAVVNAISRTMALACWGSTRALAFQV